MKLFRYFGVIALLLFIGNQYSLAQNARIATSNVGGGTACAGATISVSFTTANFVVTNRSFTVQLSNAAGSFSTPLPLAIGRTSPIIVPIPASTLGDSGYRLRVVTDTTNVDYVASEPFVVLRRSTATLTGGATINVGDSTLLNIAFTGNGPWTYTFTNTNTGTTSFNPLNGVVAPTVTTTYALQSVTNFCGAGTVAGTARVVVIPRVSTLALNPVKVCAGANLSVPFAVTGAFETPATYTAQLSDATGSFAAPLTIGTGTTSPLSSIIPVAIIAGAAYRIRVIASATATTIASQAFAIRPLPTATLSGTASINVSESANLSFTFTGDGPWTYRLSDGTNGTATISPVTVTVKPAVSTTYALQSVTNECGNGTVSTTPIKITVIPNINTALLNPVKICAGANLSVPFVLTGAFETAVTYTAQLSDATGSFAAPLAIGTGATTPIAATLPAITTGGAAYQIRVIASTTATTIASQAFAIRPLPTAGLSGTASINVGDASNLLLAFTGDGPWTYRLSDGTSGTAASNPATLSVKPTVSTTYSLQSVANECGNGTVSNTPVRITVIPRLSTADLNLGGVCAGVSVSVPFTITGSFESAVSYIAQLSDATGSFVTPTNLASSNSSPISVVVPANAVAGTAYRLRVVASGNASSVSSPSFGVRVRPTAAIAGNATINFGETANVTLTFTGDSPWTYTLSDGSSNTSNQTPLVVSLKPNQNTTYVLNSIRNLCGDGSTSGSASVTVIPRLATEDISTVVCVGNSLEIRFGIGGVLPANTNYLVQLSDSTGGFAAPVLLGSGLKSPISVVIPATLLSANNYRIRVLPDNNSNTNVLATKPFSIRRKATATLNGGGNFAIKPSEEAFLIVQLTGDAPWNVSLSDNLTFAATASPLVVAVKPIFPTTYTLQSVSNSCGLGTVSGSATVNVLITNVEDNPQALFQIYPNPVSDRLHLQVTPQKPEAGEWLLLNANGQILQKQVWPKQLIYQTETPLQDLPAGTYLLRLRVGEKWFSRKVVKK